jgi:hypothetical protein
MRCTNAVNSLATILFRRVLSIETSASKMRSSLAIHFIALWQCVMLVWESGDCNGYLRKENIR